MILDIIVQVVAEFVWYVVEVVLGAGVLRLLSLGRYPPKEMSDRDERVVRLTGCLTGFALLVGIGIATVFACLYFKRQT